MEYTNLKYFLFKLSNLFNGKLFIVLVALVIVIGATLFFIYDYKHDGPVLARSEENIKSDTSKEGKHSKKSNNKTELLYVIVPVMILLVLFGIKISLSNFPAPDAIIPNNAEKNVVKGKVLWIHNSNGKVAITTKDRGNDDPIIAGVNDAPINPDTPFISSYAGTTISNEQFLTLNVGDDVNINLHPYTWKYKNHNQYGDDKHSSDVIEMLNKGNVNGYVTKSNKDVTKKKTSSPKNLDYSSDLD